GQVDVGGVTLLFRDRADLVDEVQSRLEILEFEFLLDMVVIHHVPILYFRGQWLDLFSSQRRHSAAARNAGFFRQSHNRKPPSYRSSLEYRTCSINSLVD